MVAMLAPDETAVRFGRELRAWRERQGLTQAGLARRVNGNYSYVSRIESGQRLPSRATTLLLADALHLNEGVRIRFLSLAGFVERPLTKAQAAAIAAMTATTD